MTARKKKRKRAAMVEGLTREEMYEMMDEMYRAMEKGMAKAEPTMEEIRRAIEAARYAIGEVGEFHVESGEEGYTIRLSRHVKGRATYDPRTGRIVIILPDTTQWRQNPDGRWDRRALGVHVNMMEKLHEARQQVHWLEGEIRRLQSLAAPPTTLGSARRRGSSHRCPDRHTSSKTRYSIWNGCTCRPYPRPAA